MRISSLFCTRYSLWNSKKEKGRIFLISWGNIGMHGQDQDGPKKEEETLLPESCASNRKQYCSLFMFVKQYRQRMPRISAP